MKETIQDEAIDFLRVASDVESYNRQQAQDDLRFGYGEQWPAQMTNARHLEQRPWFVVNETDSYIRQICNQMRQQRPRIKVQGANNQTDAELAKIVNGICRHIEQGSDADTAYDTAAEFAVRMGWGYFRLTADYCDPKSFDQDIRVEAIHNPFSVYFDSNSEEPDGSDAKGCLITDLMDRKVFERMYPGADPVAWYDSGEGDKMAEWRTKDQVRLAEYYKISERKERLIRLSDDSVWWEDEAPSPEKLERWGVKVTGERDSWRPRLKWYKLTAKDVLDERDLPGIYIPVVPVYGANLVIDGKIRRFGVIRAAKDPQRMLNYWQTAVTELVALASKAKWLLAEGQDEGYEEEWSQANVKALPVLHYRQRDLTGQPAPPPQRVQPEPPPEGAMAAAQAAHDNLQRVLGMFDPAMRTGGNMSGKALVAEQQQSDMSNFHFYDNLTRSIKHGGRIIVGWIPTYYKEKRVLRIIGDDGRPSVVTINDSNAVGKIENDVSVGKYEIVMDTGPGYNSKRQEAAATMTEMVKAYPQLFQVAGDLLFRNMDFPGAEVVADRLAAANPLAQIDDTSDIPPKAQMMIKQLQQNVQQLQQGLQAAEVEKKFGLQKTQIIEAGETNREHMRLTVKAHDVDQRTAATVHDTKVKADTAEKVEKIRAAVDLIGKHLGLNVDIAKLFHAEHMADKQSEQQEKVGNEA